MDRTNPAAGEDLEPIPDGSEDDLELALDLASEAFPDRLPPQPRVPDRRPWLFGNPGQLTVQK